MFFVSRYTTLVYAVLNLAGTLYTTISDEVRLLPWTLRMNPRGDCQLQGFVLVNATPAAH